MIKTKPHYLLKIFASDALYVPKEKSMEKYPLKFKHPSKPFNPDIANVLFRAGLIESWGRGTLKILTECQLNNLPEPIFKYEFSEFTVEFNWGKTTQKTTQKILDIIENNPYAGLEEIATLIGKISRDGVKYQINKLKMEKIIRRVGPDKGGYWEIIKQ